MSLIKQKCRECGKFFEIDDKEQAWYRERDFTFPRRCKPCRINRRKQSNRKEEN